MRGTRAKLLRALVLETNVFPRPATYHFDQRRGAGVRADGYLEYRQLKRLWAKEHR